MPSRPKQRKRFYRPRVNRRSSNNSTPRRSTGRRNSSRFINIYSERIYRKQLKTNHNVREIYPINLSDLVDQGNIGTDVDVKLVGYSMGVHFATGNRTDTVSVALSHSGPWVRTGPTDGFNQQFLPRNLRFNKQLFRKSVLPVSERSYLNPHHDFPSPIPPAVAVPPNTIDLEVIDPCGVVPGVNVVITFRAHFVRPHMPASIFEADVKAADLYVDQDVNDTSTAPDPNQPKPDPPVASDMPSIIYLGISQTMVARLINDTTVEYQYVVNERVTTYTFKTATKVNLTGTADITGNDSTKDSVLRYLKSQGFHPLSVTDPIESLTNKYRSLSLPRRF